MSFRMLLVLLCLSTMVIAQVPLVAPPSPSIPEAVNPEQLPSSTGNEKPIAPRPIREPQRNGLRLAASLSDVDDEVQNPSRHVAASRVEPTTSVKAPSPKFPRTASRDSHSLVPIPRDLPGLIRDDESQTDRLVRELARKQRQFDEIKAEIEQLSIDIAAAEPAQVSVAMVVYEVVGDKAHPLLELLAPTSKGVEKEGRNTVVISSESENVLKAMADAQLLKALSRPTLITANGREAGIEVRSGKFSIEVTVTPIIEDSEWSIDSVWLIKDGDSTLDYSAITRFEEGKISACRITDGSRTFIGVVRPQVVVPKESITPVSYVPLPSAPASDSDVQQNEVTRNVDINLKKHAISWKKVY